MSFDCNVCDIKFNFHYELILHRTSFHSVSKCNENSEFHCQLCNTKIINEDHLKNHTNRHAGKCTFICGVCGKEYGRENNYVTHIQKHFRQLVCMLCDKEFTSNRNLTVHIKIKHTRESKFKCEVCSKVFVREDKMIQHSKIHSVNSNDKANKENIKETPVKIFKCDVCKKMFTRKSNLKQHALHHANESKITCECECCGKVFFRSDHKERHKRLHSCNYSSKECRCTVCCNWFPKDALKLHMM